MRSQGEGDAHAERRDLREREVDEDDPPLDDVQADRLETATRSFNRNIVSSALSPGKEALTVWGSTCPSRP